MDGWVIFALYHTDCVQNCLGMSNLYKHTHRCIDNGHIKRSNKVGANDSKNQI